MVLMINMNEPQYINTRLATYMLISITTGSQRERERLTGIWGLSMCFMIISRLYCKIDHMWKLWFRLKFLFEFKFTDKYFLGLSDYWYKKLPEIWGDYVSSNRIRFESNCNSAILDFYVLMGMSLTARQKSYLQPCTWYWVFIISKFTIPFHGYF